MVRSNLLFFPLEILRETCLFRLLPGFRVRFLPLSIPQLFCQFLPLVTRLPINFNPRRIAPRSGTHAYRPRLVAETFAAVLGEHFRMWAGT